MYLSDFFEKNKSLYYDNLTVVREKNNLTQWFKFFLVGVIETANSSIRTFDHILKLQNKTNEKLPKLGRRTANAHKVMTHLYQNPILNAAKVAAICEITPASAYKLIEEMVRLEIIKETKEGGEKCIFLKSMLICLSKKKRIVVPQDLRPQLPI